MIVHAAACAPLVLDETATCFLSTRTPHIGHEPTDTHLFVLQMAKPTARMMRGLIHLLQPNTRQRSPQR
jgi:hypothetical protein